MGLYKRWSFKRVAGTKKGFTGNRSKTIICNFRVESECTVVANKGHKTLKNETQGYNYGPLTGKDSLCLIYAARRPWPVVFLLSWFQVQEVVDELRILLQENALTKKTQQQRLKILTSAFYRNTTRFSEDMSIATNLVPNKNSISFSLWKHH